VSQFGECDFDDHLSTSGGDAGGVDFVPTLGVRLVE